MKKINKIEITVIVSVKNEGLNLSKCLEKLGRFSQVIVVDSQSIDETLEIAKKMNAEILQFNWNGKFPKKRNWTLENASIKNEWVLFLDADEFVTDNFVSEVEKKTINTAFNGFTIQFENYFMEKKLRYGYGFSKNTLFKRNKGKFEKIEEDSWSHLDMEVHEHPIIEGSIGVVNEKIIHNDFRGLEHYISKHNAYSTWEAHRYLNMYKQTDLKLTTNQKIKYSLLNTGLLPFVYFFGAYIIKLGFLDGKPGYYLARYKANYFFQIRTKIIELKRITKSNCN
tara:strand:+ start:275 stop:1120 length:846 start_codon:yes stop_codon:yes gene_type:complete